MLRALKLSANAKPGLGVSQRSGLLVAASGPYHTKVDRVVAAGPLRRLAVGGTISAFRVGLAAGAHTAVEQATRSRIGGDPTTPAQAAEGRRLLVAGTAATVVAGLALQRFINHTHMSGKTAEVGRFLGSQLAIGGTASGLVMGTDALLGRPATAHLSAGSTALLIASAMAQSRVLRRLSPRLTLPAPPESVVIPVQGRWRVREQVLPLAS
jgi:hypothetical protein